MSFNLPKGCAGFVRPKKFNFISWGIMTYSMIKERIPKRYRVPHAFMLWENGKIHESNLEGNQERDISKYMNENWEFWLFRNDQMSTNQYNSGRAFSQARIGLPYDIPAFLKFLIKWIPQVKWADICSEFQALVIRFGIKLQWVPSIDKSHKITPSKAFMYADSAQGKLDNWCFICYWNGKEKLNIY